MKFRTMFCDESLRNATAFQKETILCHVYQQVVTQLIYLTDYAFSLYSLYILEILLEKYASV